MLFLLTILSFFVGGVKSLTDISKLLKDYASYSGQIFNPNKSIINARGMSQEGHNILDSINEFSIDYPPFIYLGVPIFIGKPKAKYFSSLADNIKPKLASWKAKMLSMAGRLMLVRSIVHSMMVHYISVYNLSANIISNIERWMRNFIWSGNMDKKKLVTLAWKKCCSMFSEGGLGIIYLKHYNTTSNLHICCKFLNQNQFWSKLLTARLKKKGKLINYSIKSSLWKSFKEVYDMVMENCTWIIGNGKTVNFWRDNWAGEILAFKFKIP